MRAPITSRVARSFEGADPRAFKIVVTGPFAAGKTTLIQTISETDVLATDRVVTDETSAIKDQTTVAMDFGSISFGDDLALHLFGTPGQRRFEVMWEILAEGMAGFILLVNAAEPLAPKDAAHILNTFRARSNVPFAIGLTHIDEVATPPEVLLSSVRMTLGLGLDVPLLACDPRSREDVKALLLAVLEGIMVRLHRGPR
jgi:signal recognition particle receptor subunit beta